MLPIFVPALPTLRRRFADCWIALKPILYDVVIELLAAEQASIRLHHDVALILG
jgi:hypothetical protein